MQRKKSGNPLLTSEQNDKASDIAETIAQATAVFGSQEDGLAWVTAPAMALNGKRPVDCWRRPNTDPQQIRYFNVRNFQNFMHIPTHTISIPGR